MLSAKLVKVISQLAVCDLPSDYYRGVGFVVATVKGKGESFRVDIIDPEFDKPVRLWSGNPPYSLWPKTLKTAQHYLPGAEVVWIGRKGDRCNFLVAAVPLKWLEEDNDDTEGKDKGGDS